MTTPSAAELIRIAKAEVGTHEGHNSHGWNNIQKYSEQLPGFSWSDGQPWCDTFAAWCAWRSGLTEDLFPRSASCDASGAAWKKLRRWSEYPAVGAQVFFGTPSDLQHTGIVTGYDDTYIHTVEGNTNASGSYQGDGVYAKIHERRDARVIGYGYPVFPEGIVSADPAWQNQTKPPVLKHTKFVGDYSTVRPDPQALVDAEFRGVMRYLSPPGGLKKDLTRDEAAKLHAAGLWIALVWESTAGRAEEGHDAAVADAKAADAAAEALGYPADAVIFYAVDKDTTAARVSAYFTGLSETSRRPVGIYGGVKVIDAGLAKFAWQTEAWSGGKVSPKADMLQHTKPTHPIPGGVDENVLLHRRRFRVWKPEDTPVPPPPPPPPAHHQHAEETASLNVKSFPRMVIDYVKADLARAVTLTSLLNLQEIEPQDYKNAVAALPGFEVSHLDTECPTAWEMAVWRSKGGRKTVTHGGLAAVSPYRVVTEEDLELIANGAVIDDMNTHMVSKAFWSPSRGLKPTSYLWRRRMWKRHKKVMKQLVADSIDRGVSVLIHGDFNHRGVPKFHPDQETLIEGALDGIAFVPAPGGAKVTLRRAEAVKDGWHTDHPMMRARLKVTP